MRRIIRDHSDRFSRHQFPTKRPRRTLTSSSHASSVPIWPLNARCISPSHNPSIAIPDAACVLQRASTLSMTRANCCWRARGGSGILTWRVAPMFAIENLIRINQALILFFQPDTEFLSNSLRSHTPRVPVPGEPGDLYRRGVAALQIYIIRFRISSLYLLSRGSRVSRCRRAPLLFSVQQSSQI
jgi:hypothetical protein